MQKRTVDRPLLRWAAFSGDLAASLAALGLARWIRLHLPVPFTSGLLPPRNFSLHGATVALALAIQCFALMLFGFYGPRVRSSGSLTRLLLPALAVQLFSFTTVFYFFPARSIPRSVVVLYLVLDGALV
jgi:hypothetical protein